MTIACCYVSPEGVVFGADSTTSYRLSGEPHYFNHAQKLFQIGEDSALAAIFWGMAGLPGLSLRTLLAQLADDLSQNAAANVKDMMDRWIVLFAAAYGADYPVDPSFKAAIDEARVLGAQPPFGPAAAPGARTQAEEDRLIELRTQFTVGFCIGGYTAPSRTPMAYFVHFEPHVPGTPAAAEIPMNSFGFWGAPNMIQRLLFGMDNITKQAIVNSANWKGGQVTLDAVLAPHALSHPVLPLREVIDYVHACIHTTIKALKFSHLAQVCGGPVELAVVSSDRRFRWVRHKEWDAAVVDGELP